MGALKLTITPPAVEKPSIALSSAAVSGYAAMKRENGIARERRIAGAYHHESTPRIADSDGSGGERGGRRPR